MPGISEPKQAGDHTDLLVSCEERTGLESNTVSNNDMSLARTWHLGESILSLRFAAFWNDEGLALPVFALPFWVCQMQILGDFRN